MARTPTECDEIIAAHKEADTILMIGFMKRFNHSMLKVAELLENEAIGRVMDIRHNWDWGGMSMPSLGRTGGGNGEPGEVNGRITVPIAWIWLTGGPGRCTR